MEGVEHLGQYVFEMTNAKVEALRAERGLATITEGVGDGGSLLPVVGTVGAEDVPIRTIGDEEDGAEDDEPDAANDVDDDDDDEEDEEQDPEPDVKEAA